MHEGEKLFSRRRSGFGVIFRRVLTGCVGENEKRERETQRNSRQEEMKAGLGGKASGYDSRVNAVHPNGPEGFCKMYAPLTFYLRMGIPALKQMERASVSVTRFPSAQRSLLYVIDVLQF